VGKDRIIEIQRTLMQLAYDPGRPDGVLGNQTIQAIDQFRDDYGIQSGRDDLQGLMTAFKRHTGIAQLHRDWPTIQKNDDFVRWIDEQTITSPELCKQTVASGSVTQVASLVDLYKFYKIKRFLIQWTRF
jgi:peptidoglycan hydrolase-like protein with peptidoglycan-binding domain